MSAPPFLEGMAFGPQEGASALAIVGTSAINGLGTSPYETWAFRRADMAAFVDSPFRCDNGERATMARIRTLPPRLFGAARLAALGPRLLQPFAGVLRALPPRARIGLGLALPARFGRTGSARAQHRALVATWERAFAELGLEVMIHTEERGHAGFAHALLTVAAGLEQQDLDVALVGGLDSYYDPEAIQELLESRRLFDGELLDSMIPGEGGAMLLLARRTIAAQLGWPVVGEIRAVAIGHEPATPDNDLPCLGQGLSTPAIACLQLLKRRQRPLGWWLSDLTGEEFRVHELQLVWPRVSGEVAMPGVTLDFLPSHLGDLGAATLPTAVAIAVEGLNRRAPAAQHALCTASSISSERGCVLVEAGLPHGQPATRATRD